MTKDNDDVEAMRTSTATAAGSDSIEIETSEIFPAALPPLANNTVGLPLPALPSHRNGHDGDKSATADNDGDDADVEKDLDNVDDELLHPFLHHNRRGSGMTASQRLVVDKRVYHWSLLAMRLGVLADSVNNTILRPNYPFMVLPGAHPDSFPSTAPFEFASAQYFLPLTNLLATAIAATFVGSLSDKIGRRPVMLTCVGFGVIGSIAKFLASGSFWGFCAANFFTGLFGATLSVSIACKESNNTRV